MPKKAVIQNSFLTYNKGCFLSAKIYSDIRGNKCDCGDKFTGKESFKGYDFPVCSSCGENPSRLRIMANILDINGSPKRITIRYTQDGERLTDIVECLTTLKRIKQEIKEGIFDVRKYDSEESKEEFIFKNFLTVYDKHHEKRYNEGKITFAGLRDKRKAYPHLLKHFKEIDISKLRKLHITKFEDEFTGSDNTLRKTKSELRTILNFAIRKEMITKLPDLGKIGKSKLRKHTMSEDDGLLIISNVSNTKYQDIMMLLTIYPVRPGEIRALKWKNVDLIKNEITFDNHFSDGQETSGRKSRSEGEKLSSITLNISSLAKKIILRQIRSINKNEFVFKGKNGGAVSESALNRSWTKAREKSGYKASSKNRYHMYELKHIRLSKMNELVDGNIKILEQASGVDVRTLMERYVQADMKQVNQYFQ